MEFKNHDFFKTFLYFVCELGNIELVKYIISLNIIDITLKNIFNYSLFIKFPV